MTKAQLQKMDQQFSVQYEAWQKDRDRRRQETEFLLDQQNSAAAPAQPARQEPVKMAMLTTPEPAWQGPPVGAAGTAAAPGHAIAPPVASGQPLTTPATPATPANSGTSVPPNQQTREKPATAEANHTGTPPPAGGTSTPPVQPNPPAAVWNPYDQTNYKAGAKQCEEAMAESKKGDDTNGQEAIGHYKAAIQKISTASDLWATVLQQALQNGAGVEGLRQNIADCDANRQVWEANIATIQKQMAAPKPATGGTAAPAGGAGSGEFYAGNAKWLAGKKEFKLGYDLFTDHISHGTGQASQVLNKYIDEAVEHFNKAEDLWSDAEQDWFKKFPGKSGPAADAKMMDDAMQESQFYRYACMKMHTF